MVQTLVHVYPTELAVVRGTADADAGVSTQIAASRHFHDQLLCRAYSDTSGNRYERKPPDSHDRAGENTMITVDLLVPSSGPQRTVIIGGRGFDPGPGLGLALATAPLRVDVTVRMLDGGQCLEFAILVPDVEVAVALKALAWQSRRADKDLMDLASLFEIVNEHRAGLSQWALDRAPLIGVRLDAARALGLLLVMLDKGRVNRSLLLNQPPSRLATLIRKHVQITSV
ncbi:hypothetical protein [Nocardia sp. NPDC058705]|uniref:hypothetical protein n=1 Tax=Nocardia sp. NPDC058705 TaxID=3346609 RepID=UPI0036B392C5